MPTVACKDCLAEGVTKYRPTPHGGPKSPLCVTHHRARRKRRSERNHELRTKATYGLSKEQYLALYESQNRRCFICQRATGETKRLAVDHDHWKEGCGHAPDVGCPRCVRCLACGPCNELLGRYNALALWRAIVVLTDPPAQKVLSRSGA